MARTLPRHLLDTTTADLRAIADFENRKYPQYAGHWDGPEWILVEITTDVRTKLGRAFFAGELALAKRDTLEGKSVWTAYSRSNRCNTVIARTKALASRAA